MVPPIEVSVTRVEPRRWILGSEIICEKVGNQKLKPANAIISWQDGGSTFYLRGNTDSSTLAGDAETDRIHFAGTSAAVWSIGENAICKVHAWCEGLELEADTIQFVRQHAKEVPVPEVLYTWIDHKLNRTFLIMKRVSGQTLEQAWPRLSSSQRIQIADDIARYCVILAKNTSSMFKSVSGGGVYESRLMDDPPPSHPTWLPMTVSPFSSKALIAYMKKISTQPPPDIDNTFHFYHADLGPTNIMISSDGSVVTAIIDWESGAYYPRFWIATKPAASSVYWLECNTDEPKLWGELLTKGLQANNFKSLDTIWLSWILAIKSPC